MNFHSWELKNSEKKQQPQTEPAPRGWASCLFFLLGVSAGIPQNGKAYSVLQIRAKNWFDLSYHWARRCEGRVWIVPSDVCLCFNYLWLQDEEIKLTADTLVFSGTSGGKLYGLDVKLFKPVNPDESTTKVLPRSIQMFIKKVRRRRSRDQRQDTDLMFSFRLRRKMSTGRGIDV